MYDNNIIIIVILKVKENCSGRAATRGKNSITANNQTDIATEIRIKQCHSGSYNIMLHDCIRLTYALHIIIEAAI